MNPRLNRQLRLQRRTGDHTKVAWTPVTKQATVKRMELRQETATVLRALVSVVDDDESVRESLPGLLKEFGFEPRAFSSAAEFLLSDYVNRTECLILDIGMPNTSGIELQRELQLRGQKIPIVFITAQTDGAVRARALDQGAVSVLLKPFSKTDLLAAVKTALGTR